MKTSYLVAACLELVRHVPSTGQILLFGAPLLAFSAGCLALAARLKQRHRWRTGYSRKTFHLLTFSTACALQALFGLTAVMLFAEMTTLVLSYALLQGEGHPWFEALARESDAPHRAYGVVVSYVATVIGGLA